MIAPSFVLTAAHCTGPNEGKGPLFPADEYAVEIGQVNLDRLTPQNGFGVVNVTRHPQWDPTPGSSVVVDVAILELDRPAPADLASPAPFVGAGDAQFGETGQPAVVAG